MKIQTCDYISSSLVVLINTEINSRVVSPTFKNQFACGHKHCSLGTDELPNAAVVEKTLEKMLKFLLPIGKNSMKIVWIF